MSSMELVCCELDDVGQRIYILQANRTTVNLTDLLTNQRQTCDCPVVQPTRKGFSPVHSERAALQLCRYHPDSIDHSCGHRSHTTISVPELADPRPSGKARQAKAQPKPGQDFFTLIAAKLHRLSAFVQNLDGQTKALQFLDQNTE